MGNVDDTRLISGVWYRLTFPLGKVYRACCMIEDRGDGLVTFFEFEDESRKAAGDIIPYLSDLSPIDPPENGLYRIEDFLDDEDTLEDIEDLIEDTDEDADESSGP